MSDLTQRSHRGNGNGMSTYGRYDCWRIRPGRLEAGTSPSLAVPSYPVVYVADATPGMMKRASDLVDSHSEAGGGPEAVDTLRPRARPTVWPGRRPVPGIVAPGSPGEHAEQNVSLATSPAAGLQGSVGVSRSGAPKSVPSSGSSTTEARLPANGVTPCASWGSGGVVAPIAESRPGFSEQYPLLLTHQALLGARGPSRL
jgi:hypothetical protein